MLQLPLRAIPDFEPKIIIVKPFPKPEWADKTKQLTNYKRKLNHIMEREVKLHDIVKTVNTDSIRPNEFRQFDHKGNLSG